VDHIEYVYTLGMDEGELEERLAAAENGVLSLADGGAAYGVPVSFEYEPGDEHVTIRLGEHEDSDKLAFLETTTRACLTCYGFEAGESWSVLAEGPIERVATVEADVDAATVNEAFVSLRVFGEDVADLTVGLYELAIESATGRRTVDPASEGL
jgi:hypothetical protein